jgi:2-hydroxychromene-2-carboxylate isomerase
MAELADVAFYFHLASPDCYLAAERVLHVLPAPVDWQPVLAGTRREESGGEHRAAIERRARELELLPIRWPRGYPVDGGPAMLVATYAREIGRGAAFAQAAFRQAFAAGHSLADTQHVLIAAAACEIHPAAVLRAIERRGVRERLTQASAQAEAAGVTKLPAVRVGARVFGGENCLHEAATHLHTRTRPLASQAEAIAP